MNISLRHRIWRILKGYLPSIQAERRHFNMTPNRCVLLIRWRGRIWVF